MLEVIKFGVQVLQFLAWIGVGIYAWSANRDKVTTDQLQALRERMARHEERLEHLASVRAIGELAVDIKGLQTEIVSLRAWLERHDRKLGEP
jgi:predicted  nucleic acid-binding Zn-ribbon protein